MSIDYGDGQVIHGEDVWCDECKQVRGSVISPSAKGVKATRHCDLCGNSNVKIYFGVLNDEKKQN